MATTTTVHAQLIRYATNGDQVIVNLKSAGADISIDRTNTKLPTSVTTAQSLANALGNLAFKDSLGKGDVGLGSVDNTADANKSVKYATSAGSAGSATKLATARAINGVNFDGSSGITITANPTENEIAAKDLNTITTPGIYFAGGSNTNTNKPSGVDAFGMLVFKTASGYITQILVEGNGSASKTWIRQYSGSAWSAWGYYYNTSYKPSKSDVGLGNVDNTADSAKSVKYATSAGSAGSATKDSANQQINTTYIKGLSANGRTITITKGDGTTSTLTTQDTNTTYGVFAKATADAAGGTGLVPAPAKGQQGLYLRGDGSWATPTNTTYGVFKAATSSAAGGTGLVPQPAAGAQGKFLRGDGTWQTPTNTWRGVQDNLTSTATDQSLSANQGKVLKGLIDGKAAASHTHTASQITDNIPASKITGVLSLSNIPAGALERLIPVADDTARFKLTKDNAQNGDVIKVTTTGKMYFIKDETKLSTEDGYEVFAAGTAAAVAWTNVTGRPSSMPASDVHPWAKAASKPSYSKSEVGLSNVDNTADANKSVKYATSAGSAGSVAWANVSGKPTSMPASDVYAWAKAASKPSYSKGEVGLGNVDNTADSAKSVKYATSAGSASNVKDSNDSTVITFAYSKAGLDYGAYTWLAAWNGRELRAVNKNQFAPASHSHNYAGSGSAGGAANSANKLSAARTVSGGTDITLSFNYDGSGNSNANIGYYSSSASVGDSNNYPFHRFAKLDTITASYSDKSTTFFISQDYNGGGFGIVRIVLRTNNSSSVSTVDVKWLVRCGLSADSVQVGIYNVFGKTYADAFFKTGGSYAGTYFRAIASGARGGASRTWVMINSSEVSGTSATNAKTSTECYASIAAAGTALHKQAYTGTVSGTDGGTASYANSAGSANSVAWGNVSGRPSSMPASDVHPWAKAANKPSYSKSEVGLGNVDNTADSAKSVKYATSAGSAGSVAWGNVSGKPSTFAPSSHSHSAATASASGFMSNTDKAKLDFGDIVYVSKTTPTKSCIWVKLD